MPLAPDELEKLLKEAQAGMQTLREELNALKADKADPKEIKAVREAIDNLTKEIASLKSARVSTSAGGPEAPAGFGFFHHIFK